MKVRALVLLALTLGVTLPSLAQTCSNTPGTVTNTLICVVPQLFGSGGLHLVNTVHNADFQNATFRAFLPLNGAIGEELSNLPLGSAGSGVSVTFDQNNSPVSTEDSLGPILTERAGVVGKGKVDVGAAYQYFTFSQIDGLNINNLHTVLEHVLLPGYNPQPDLVNDYIKTVTNLNVSLNQTVLYAVAGLTNRVDVSLEVPIESVHLTAASNATLVRKAACEQTNPPTCQGFGEICNEYHYFGDPTQTCAQIIAAITQAYPTSGNAHNTDATGIGDVILRGKYQVIRGEKVAAAIGVGLRLPSGDANNFLGSGTYGVTPFGAWTYRARLSPHLRLGYQWNGSSILAGDPTAPAPASPKASLPPQLLYSGGADYWINKRITISADLIGARVFSAPRLQSSTYTLDSANPSIPDLSHTFADYSSDAIGVGAKIRLKGELLLVGNVTTRIDNGGLVARVVPLVGLSYAFK